MGASPCVVAPIDGALPLETATCPTGESSLEKREAPPAAPDRAAGGPGPCTNTPNEEPGKLNTLREYWGKKESVGFAGPQMDSTRVSKGEAEVKLQRLIASGGRVDFEEVRRL